jgi:polyisoprenoid-binding protein YceI
VQARLGFVLSAAVAAHSAFATTASAQRAVTDAVLRSGTLSFHGRATVGDFIGSTSTISGAITGGASYSTTTGWVEAPVATLATGNAHRDRDLRASMEVDRHPTMHFTLAGATVVTTTPLGGSDSSAVLLHGALAIHGVTRHVDVPATIVRSGDTTRVIAAFPIDLGDYGIGGLTKMLGLLRMEHEIDVHVDLRFVDDPHPATDP